MAPGSNNKGRGHVRDEEDKNDKWVDMQSLHHSVDLTTLPSFNIFANRFWVDPHGNNTKHYEKHIYDQGSVSSCTSNAVASAYRYALQRHGVSDFKPSRLFLYYVARTQQKTLDTAGYKADERGAYYASLKDTPPKDAQRLEAGTKIRENVRVLRKLGAPVESDLLEGWPAEEWPYISVEDYAKLPDGLIKQYAAPAPPAAASGGDSFYPANSLPAMCPAPQAFASVQQKIPIHYARPHIGSLDCWKRCIVNGYPIICGIDEYKHFSDSIKSKTHVARTPAKSENDVKTHLETEHTVLVVGFDNDKPDELEKYLAKDDPVLNGPRGCFVVQNSWGETDTDDVYKGCFWMPYAWITMDSPVRDPDVKMADGAWVLVDRAELASGPPSTSN